MLKQLVSKIKKELTILLVVFFVVSLTVTSASAVGDDPRSLPAVHVVRGDPVLNMNGVLTDGLVIQQIGVGPLVIGGYAANRMFAQNINLAW
jgi:hypothetical protein